MRPFRNTARFYSNKIAKEVLSVERSMEQPDFAQIKHLVSGQRGREVFSRGEVDAGVWTAGMVMGLIDDVPECRVLVERIVGEAKEIIEGRLAKMIV